MFPQLPYNTISKLGASYFLETPVDIPLLNSFFKIKSYVIAQDKSRARENNLITAFAASYVTLSDYHMAGCQKPPNLPPL